jgi:hypothetical protein
VTSDKGVGGVDTFAIEIVDDEDDVEKRRRKA